MSRLEAKVRGTLGAIINDLSVPISTEEQRSISLWAMKTVMVFEAVTEESKWFYTQPERAALAERSVVPAGTRIWLGRSLQSNNTDAESRTLAGRRRDGYSTVLVAGRALIQVLTIRHPDVPLRVKAGPWDAGLQEIWPTGPLIHWPSGRSFDEGELEDLHRRFVTSRQG
jgi:hypothetical protein